MIVTSHDRRRDSLKPHFVNPVDRQLSLPPSPQRLNSASEAVHPSHLIRLPPRHGEDHPLPRPSPSDALGPHPAGKNSRPRAHPRRRNGHGIRRPLPTAIPSTPTPDLNLEPQHPQPRPTPTTTRSSSQTPNQTPQIIPRPPTQITPPPIPIPTPQNSNPPQNSHPQPAHNPPVRRRPPLLLRARHAVKGGCPPPGKGQGGVLDVAGGEVRGLDDCAAGAVVGPGYVED
jgi:hypothetical protein